MYVRGRLIKLRRTKSGERQSLIVHANMSAISVLLD
jgi:hypothetical protein